MIAAMIPVTVSIAADCTDIVDNNRNGNPPRVVTCVDGSGNSVASVDGRCPEGSSESAASR